RQPGHHGRTMERLVAATVVGIALMLSPRLAAAQMKIAIIDSERAISETDDGQRAQAALKKLSDSRQADLDSKQKVLQPAKEALEKEAAAGKVPREVLQRKADALQKRITALQQSYNESQTEVQKKRAELTQPIVQRMMNIVRTIATQEGYDAVIDRSAVPY